MVELALGHAAFLSVVRNCNIIGVTDSKYQVRANQTQALGPKRLCQEQTRGFLVLQMQCARAAKVWSTEYRVRPEELVGRVQTFGTMYWYHAACHPGCIIFLYGVLLTWLAKTMANRYNRVPILDLHPVDNRAVLAVSAAKQHQIWGHFLSVFAAWILASAGNCFSRLHVAGAASPMIHTSYFTFMAFREM